MYQPVLTTRPSRASTKMQYPHRLLVHLQCLQESCAAPPMFAPSIVQEGAPSATGQCCKEIPFTGTLQVHKSMGSQDRRVAWRRFWFARPPNGIRTRRTSKWPADSKALRPRQPLILGPKTGSFAAFCGEVAA
jgi:hypothetical protein